MQIVQDTMKELRFSPDLLYNYWTGFAIAAGLSVPMGNLAKSIIVNKGTMICTNVPGPDNKITFSNVGTSNIFFFAPAMADVGLSCSIISYNETVTVAFNCDSSLVEDPSLLVKYYKEEFSGLLESLLPQSSSKSAPANIETSALLHQIGERSPKVVSA